MKKFELVLGLTLMVPIVWLGLNLPSRSDGRPYNPRVMEAYTGSSYSDITLRDLAALTYMHSMAGCYKDLHALNKDAFNCADWYLAARAGE